MIKEDLVQYINRQLSHGHNVTTIREHLLKHNYKEDITDEALHKAAELFGASIPKKKPYKKIAYAFIALLALSGIVFAMFFMQNSEDLSGAASEPEPVLIIETPQEETTEEIPIEEVIEEPVSDELVEPPLEEEVVEKTIPDEQAVVEETPTEEAVEEPVQAPTGCTSNSHCDAGYVCYLQICEIDNDRDLVSDTEETEKGMNHLDQDTDDDGYFDFIEIEDATNPLDASSPGYTTCATTADCNTGQACNDKKICISCSDTDSTKYKTKGITYGVHYVSNKQIFTQDSCVNAGSLMEFYCTTDNYLYYKTINCEQEEGIGYYCSNGKCVTE